MTHAVMQELSDGYSSESGALYALLTPLAEARWNQPTQFKEWTLNDILAHLAFFDACALLSLHDEKALSELFSQLRAAVSAGTPSLTFAIHWLGNVKGTRLLAAWHEQSMRLAEDYSLEDPKRRTKWAGPDMSVRSSLSARLMETWAHAQAIYDLLGQRRVEGEYLRDIAELGVNTYKWSFVNRKLPVPEPQPFVRLISPAGASWEWGQEITAERIEGSASEFCQVVAQTRNVEDTSLRVTGFNAVKWRAIAQCFAGVARDPPSAGTRFRQLTA